MKAHELLADRSKWTQGAIALNAAGKYVSSTSPDAVCFCAHGAIVRCHRGDYGSTYMRADAKALALFGRGLVAVNDELGYDAVMRVLREAGV